MACTQLNIATNKNLGVFYQQTTQVTIKLQLHISDE